MATQDVTTPKPFRTLGEWSRLSVGAEHAPALLFNPEAMDVALASAAAARAETLHQMLDYISSAGDVSTAPASEVAGMLGPIAHEFSQILEELVSRMDETARGTGKKAKSEATHG